MNKAQMVYKLKQLGHNQEKIAEIFIGNKEFHRAEIAQTKHIMYENFAELLEHWLEDEKEAEEMTA
ncbi:MAG: hypothetical protein L0F95_04525 [Lactococcus sp.]|jgi:hypothetical protein|uniref:Uncharacterized protein n=4 Tax=Pseudolactococcus TaxID=3436058 RepID=A0A7L4WBA1_9LACT|nr:MULTISPECIES: hypothetical protein [Lactococcus]MBR6895949.1 hypothetical protein [Lactococcus sp.]MCJ1969396.1 hypothetical protein [Lactococcus carnosus]MCJ1970326.1 hypothetical protein [Lactococcus carnosus]MCJ1973213.1 hypothetical protein [Lactococcus carnosus]MCJ1975358.1 hypothetical protein [Lactococcus carnosus]